MTNENTRTLSPRTRRRRFYIALAVGSVIGTVIGMAIKGEFGLISLVGTALGLGLGMAIHSVFSAAMSDENSPSASRQTPNSPEPD